MVLPSLGRGKERGYAEGVLPSFWGGGGGGKKLAWGVGGLKGGGATQILGGGQWVI